MDAKKKTQVSEERLFFETAPCKWFLSTLIIVLAMTFGTVVAVRLYVGFILRIQHEGFSFLASLAIATTVIGFAIVLLGHVVGKVRPKLVKGRS